MHTTTGQTITNNEIYVVSPDGQHSRDNGTHLCLPVGLPGIALMLLKEHDRFPVDKVIFYDNNAERQEIVARWLAQPRAHVPGQPVDDTPNGARLFTIVELAVEALGYRIQQVGRAEQMAIGKILSGLGYETRVLWCPDAKAVRRAWVKA